MLLFNYDFKKVIFMLFLAIKVDRSRITRKVSSFKTELQFEFIGLTFA